jgi:hypothetical protein
MYTASKEASKQHEDKGWGDCLQHSTKRCCNLAREAFGAVGLEMV